MHNVTKVEGHELHSVIRVSSLYTTCTSKCLQTTEMHDTVQSLGLKC